MSVFEKHRFEIWNQSQHPYKHTVSEFAYTNPALPGVTNMESALNWVMAVLYPNNLPAVATPAALPSSGNSINDYRVVTDDGDGKSAGYRWEQREGEVSASWHKIYDMDWGQGSVLSAFLTKTQDVYVFKYGLDDRDKDGVVVTGTYAGQTIVGGASASTNLTLKANGGDGVGANTGYVQSADNFRPTVTDALGFGTASLRWNVGYFKDLQIATLTSTGAVSVGGALAVTGTISASNFSGSSSGANTGDVTLGAIGASANANGASLAGQVLTLQPASASFGGVVTTGAQTIAGAKTFSGALVASSTLDVTGNATVGGTLGVTGAITGSNLSGTNTGNVTLAAIGAVPNANAASLSGQILTLQPADASFGGVVTTGAQTIAGAKTFSGAMVLSAAGTALSVSNNATITGNLTLTGNLINGAATFLGTELVKLRNVMFRDAARTSGVQNGDTLFYDSTSGTWLANHPDTEITHSELTGLTTGDAGHTQFALLAGRSGGQTLQGDTATGGHLVLESTFHATKGFVKTKDSLVPFTTASFSSSWSGTDLGGTSNYFRDLYTKGELKGARLENFTAGTLPSSSASAVGRQVFATDTKKVYTDTGSTFVATSVSRFISDTSWDGIIITLTVTVSATITDARNAIWQLCDNTNDYARIFCSIKPISATQVKIDVETPLAAGSYRLIGLE